MSCMVPAHASDLLQTQIDSECSTSHDAKFTKALGRRPCMDHCQSDYSPEDDFVPFDQVSSSKSCLPKGVIRGCLKCSDCQKVTARWHPEDACRPIVDEAPVFHPDEEDFKDTLKYISSIRQRAEIYGICRIVPPSSWNPPCLLKEKTTWENCKFDTRIQQIDKLQNRAPMRKTARCNNKMRKRSRRLRMGIEHAIGDEDIMYIHELGYSNEAERPFGFEPGMEFTLEAFQRYADDFKEQYFCMKDDNLESRSNQDKRRGHWEPSIENMEGEYWRMVEKPTEEIEVLYGADIETGKFGSGFPKASSGVMDLDLEEQYVKSGWNLNNISRLPGSLLSFEGADISGVVVPWLYVGMCFSSFCWHVEDHHMYSLNYLHWGAPKVWYGVPGRYAWKLEAAMKKHLPDLFEEQPDLLHKLVTQLSPSILKSEGIPVYRCVQRPGEFVITFPRSYHSGFNCGFNCAEAVNLAPVDWLPHGQDAIERYREQRRKTTVSHDKLLLGAAREAVRAHWELQLLRKNTLENLRWKDVCGTDGILAKAMKTRVDMERIRRQCLSSSCKSRKMDANFDAVNEQECTVCLYDLHLSAVGCTCSPNRYTCLSHAKQLCSCAWSSRFFLFRYEIDELNILFEALCGKLSSVYKWAHLDLGLVLSLHLTKEKSEESQLVTNLSNKSAKQGNQEVLNVITSSATAQNRRSCQEINAAMMRPVLSCQGMNPSRVTLAYNDDSYRKDTLDQNRPSVEHSCLSKMEDHSIQFREGHFVSDSSSLTLPACHVPQGDAPCSETKLKVCSVSVGDGKRSSISTKINENSLLEDRNIVLNGEAGAELHGLFSCDKSSLAPTRLMSDDTVASCNYEKNQVLNMPETSASVMSEMDVSLLPVAEREDHISRLVGIKVEDFGIDYMCTKYSFTVPNTTMTESITQNLSHNLRRPGDCNTTNVVSRLQCPPFGSGRINNKDGGEKSACNFTSQLKDGAQSGAEKPSCMQNNLDRYCQRGPRIAKVVRRINCNVEPLEYGTVIAGKSWSNSKAIFPMGFRSRVKYYSVIDPTKMCYYISEVLDAGLPGPLFMVRVEQHPSEVFIHVCPAKCWDMVRQRVNNEIRKQQSLGTMSLPPLQPQGCLDGLEMFGFSSPAIIQAIEVIDRKRVSSEYWNSRPEGWSKPGLPLGELSGALNHSIDKLAKNDENQSTSEVEATAFRGMLTKARTEELCSLQNMVSSCKWDNNRQVLMQYLNEEIQNRRN